MRGRGAGLVSWEGRDAWQAGAKSCQLVSGSSLAETPEDECGRVLHLTLMAGANGEPTSMTRQLSEDQFVLRVWLAGHTHTCVTHSFVAPV
ncbi:hypothetical protein PBY51_016788 [Eleginops maclovinus]|uniref:Uncharacterized protein n=1 Tax=Eleginops maclovinus TaxID=56733 RepID=A0AAN7WRE0_ELEMC|nr:hypothetical protein PBY51_016788 [Eleginops maclovinus]